MSEIVQSQIQGKFNMPEIVLDQSQTHDVFVMKLEKPILAKSRKRPIETIIFQIRKTVEVRPTKKIRLV